MCCVVFTLDQLSHSLSGLPFWLPHYTQRQALCASWTGQARTSARPSGLEGQHHTHCFWCQWETQLVPRPATGSMLLWWGICVWCMRGKSATIYSDANCHMTLGCHLKLHRENLAYTYAGTLLPSIFLTLAFSYKIIHTQYEHTHVHKCTLQTRTYTLAGLLSWLVGYFYQPVCKSNALGK